MIAEPAEVFTFGETMAVLSSPLGVPLRMAHSLSLSVAGAESNVAIGLARLGVRVAWFGRVGSDELGRLVLSKLAGEGVDVSCAVVDGRAPTGVMFKEARARNLTRVTYYRTGSAGSMLNPADLPIEVLVSARHMHVTGITPALSGTCLKAVDAAIASARSAGLTISLDVNYRMRLWSARDAAEVLTSLVRRVDLVFATRAEAALVLGEAGEFRDGTAERDEELCHRLTDLGPTEAVVKLGAAGAISLVDGSLRRVETASTEVVDPVGAGDAFVAGYLAEFLAASRPVERLQTATSAAAFAMATAGDWEGLPTRGDLHEWVVGADPVRR